MKGTRGQIIELLRRQRELSIAELSDAVAIAVPAVRRHLEILAGEGLVEYRSVKQPAGRPFFAYRLTEQARESPASGYARLLERMLMDAAAMPDNAGRALLDTLLERMSQHLAEEYRSRIHGETLEERVSSLIDALHSEGILERWERRDDGIHLLNDDCPYRRAAMAAHEVCDSERRAISLLLGEEVDQIGRMVDGHACCEYIVRPRQDLGLIAVG